MNLRKTFSNVLMRLKGRATGFFIVLFLSAGFLFVCNLNLYSSPHRHAVAMVKKYGVMSGLVLGLAYLVPAFVRGSFSAHVPWRKVSIHFVLIAGLLAALLLQRPHVTSFGVNFAQLTSNYWSADYTDSHTVLLKRVAMPALAHLCGFNEKTYFYFWFLIYLVALWLAVRWLMEKGLTFLECLSILTSSIFAFELIIPGYPEVLVLALALYCLQKSTGFLEKAVILTLALATHEIAAGFIFIGVIMGSPKKDREEWSMIFPCAILIDLVVTFISQVLQHGARPGETLLVGGMLPWQWMLRRPLCTVLGVFIAYKLYWLVVIRAWWRPSHRIGAGAVLLSLPLIFLGTDTSRLVQFSSLSLFMLVPNVISEWSSRTRLFLALANLGIPSIYLASNASPCWGWGLYSIYLKIFQSLGFQHGGIVW